MSVTKNTTAHNAERFATAVNSEDMLIKKNANVKTT